MPEEITNTSTNFLVPENNYEATITKVVRKEIKEFIIYEWNFLSYVEGQEYKFKIGLFSSQCADILRALGAEEVSKNRFKWDTDGVVGSVLSFNVAHVEDKKGVVREALSDIKLIGKAKKDEVTW